MSETIWDIKNESPGGSTLIVTVVQYHKSSLILKDINGNTIVGLCVNENGNLEARIIDMQNEKHLIEITGMED